MCDKNNCGLQGDGMVCYHCANKWFFITKDEYNKVDLNKKLDNRLFCKYRSSYVFAVLYEKENNYIVNNYYHFFTLFNQILLNMVVIDDPSKYKDNFTLLTKNLRIKNEPFPLEILLYKNLDWAAYKLQGYDFSALQNNSVLEQFLYKKMEDKLNLIGGLYTRPQIVLYNNNVFKSYIKDIPTFIKLNYDKDMSKFQEESNAILSEYLNDYKCYKTIVKYKALPHEYYVEHPFARKFVIKNLNKIYPEFINEYKKIWYLLSFNNIKELGITLSISYEQFITLPEDKKDFMIFVDDKKKLCECDIDLAKDVIKIYPKEYTLYGIYINEYKELYDVHNYYYELAQNPFDQYYLDYEHYNNINYSLGVIISASHWLTVYNACIDLLKHDFKDVVDSIINLKLDKNEELQLIYNICQNYPCFKSEHIETLLPWLNDENIFKLVQKKTNQKILLEHIIGWNIQADFIKELNIAQDILLNKIIEYDRLDLWKIFDNKIEKDIKMIHKVYKANAKKILNYIYGGNP